MDKRPKIRKLYKALSEELIRVRKKADQLHEAAVEIARSASASPSQSGDRFHAQGQADIARDYVKNLENIYSEIEKELNIDNVSTIRPVCWVEVKYVGGESEVFFYLSEPLALAEFKFVSVGSPFGKLIEGNSVGDKFKFLGEGIRATGMIVKIG